MANDRTAAEMELTIAVFSGPVLRKRKNSATRIDGTSTDRGPKKTITAAGSVSTALHAETRYIARWFVLSHRCAINAPTLVPTMPSITVTPPKIWFARANEYPSMRERNVGSQ